MLVIYALIGNDVCDGHPGDSQWTTVPEFTANVLAGLDYLETILPQGSHVAFVGLADGRVLYDTTHNRTHPIGVGYPDVYEFLSCNNCNPCWGWLNTNETWRNATSERAAQLTAVYDSIIATNSTRYKAFDVRPYFSSRLRHEAHESVHLLKRTTRNIFFFFQMYRMQVDWEAFINDYVSAGGDAFDLIEPADGFHPSQTGNMLLASKLWEDLAANRPDWIPKLNPNNHKIVELFGDQGGY